MKIKQTEECECDKPDIRYKFPRGCCSLNQIMKCHGDQPVDELFKHLKIEKEEK
ncbi:MAG: hypothetical protein GF383_03770 [Candidatus Lokiarchaeota archaeon]|nr:hypothetical protein [Candidatus Lokiarchaeota archaeon]MBD3338813.1 hypothetical protein [Candidatus Lokiarchaeota archaeon]